VVEILPEHQEGEWSILLLVKGGGFGVLKFAKNKVCSFISG
jgi:hypothetical protein